MGDRGSPTQSNAASTSGQHCNACPAFLSFFLFGQPCNACPSFSLITTVGWCSSTPVRRPRWGCTRGPWRRSASAESSAPSRRPSARSPTRSGLHSSRAFSRTASQSARCCGGYASVGCRWGCCMAPIARRGSGSADRGRSSRPARRSPRRRPSPGARSWAESRSCLPTFAHR